MSALRSLLRLLPCRPSELPRFRSAIVAYARRQPTEPGNDALAREYEFHLQAQKHLRELNERYFPQSGLSEKEMIGRTAAMVGYNLPKEYSPKDATEAGEDSAAVPGRR